jgi:hypothetical protein
MGYVSSLAFDFLPTQVSKNVALSAADVEARPSELYRRAHEIDKTFTSLFSE